MFGSMDITFVTDTISLQGWDDYHCIGAYSHLSFSSYFLSTKYIFAPTKTVC